MTDDVGDKPNLLWDLTLLLALSTLWGASYSFIKVGVETIPPVTLIAARTAIAAAVLIGVICWRGATLPRDAATWRRFLFQAGLNSVVPFTLIAWAEQTTEAGLATILNSTSPIFAFVLTALITRHEFNHRTETVWRRCRSCRDLPDRRHPSPSRCGPRSLGATRHRRGNRLLCRGGDFWKILQGA